MPAAGMFSGSGSRPESLAALGCLMRLVVRRLDLRPGGGRALVSESSYAATALSRYDARSWAFSIPARATSSVYWAPRLIELAASAFSPQTRRGDAYGVRGAGGKFRNIN